MKCFLILMLFVATAQAQDLPSRLEGFKAGAHQGGIFYSTPNSLTQFKAAKKDGVDIIELDLHETKDRFAIVYHDDNLNTPDCHGPIKDHTLAEVKACKLNNTGDKIPSFDEVLAWANGTVVINAEFKTREVIGPALESLQRYNAHEWVFFQTKADPERYYKARALDPNVYLLYAPKREDDLNWALNLNDPRLLVIELHKNLHSPEIIDRIHAAGKIALEDTWRYIWHKELFGAACDYIFKLKIDIGISNNPKSCAEQRDKFNSIREEEDLRLNNFHEIVKGEYYRSGQLSGSEIKDVIKKYGIKTIINLKGARPGEDWYDDELKAALEMGADHVSIGMSAKRLPHRKDLIKLLDSFRNAERPMLVHCNAGADRAGEAAAIYGLEYWGWTKKQALEMLTPKYMHFPAFMPAKTYFIEKVYQGEEWARTQYDPCQQDYKYYDKKEYCQQQ